MGLFFQLVWKWGPTSTLRCSPCLEPFWGTLTRNHRNSRAKMVIQECVRNQTRFLIDLEVSPGGQNWVPVYTRAQFSLLQPDSKKTPKWEPKWSVLGSRIPTILTLRYQSLRVMTVPKKVSKNMKNKSRRKNRQGGGVPLKEKKQSHSYMLDFSET